MTRHPKLRSLMMDPATTRGRIIQTETHPNRKPQQLSPFFFLAFCIIPLCPGVRIVGRLPPPPGWKFDPNRWTKRPPGEGARFCFERAKKQGATPGPWVMSRWSPSTTVDRHTRGWPGVGSGRRGRGGRGAGGRWSRRCHAPAGPRGGGFGRWARKRILAGAGAVGRGAGGGGIGGPGTIGSGAGVLGAKGKGG